MTEAIKIHDLVMGEAINENTPVRNVFMAKMAYLVPIPRMLRRYRDRAANPLSDGMPHFVHHLNASFCYCPYSTVNNAITFTYTSKYDGCHAVQRNVCITPYLLKYRTGTHPVQNYAIVLIATVDKYFHEKGSSIRDEEWCTPFDLVYLRKAFFESSEHGLLTAADQGRMNFCHWLTSMICEVTGVRRTGVDLHGMLSSSNLTVVGIDKALTDVEEIDAAVREQYYNPTNLSTIDDFLANDFITRHTDSGTTDARRFIHGFLMSNDNFMQLPHSCVRWTQQDFYSNNFVEGYWATDDNILSIKVGSPFVNLRDDEKLGPILSNSLTENDCLLELCVLGMLGRELEWFGRNHVGMKSHEIELRRAMIAEYLNERLLNVWELDRRMDYFMDRFRVNTRYRRLLDVAVPRGNARNVVFNRIGSLFGWTVGLLALITAILKLLKG